MQTQADSEYTWRSQYPDDIPPEISLPEHTLVARFRMQASAHPDDSAIHYFDTTITYQQLDAMSSRLANAMRSLGIDKGDRVAVNLQNVPTFWVVMLATWKLGAILVSINPMYKGVEVDYYLSDSGAKLLVIHDELYNDDLQQVVASSDVAHVIVTSPLDLLDQPPPPPLAAYQPSTIDGTHDLIRLIDDYTGDLSATPLTLEDVAFLTYTSGTTGQPKGAMNTHMNVAFNAEIYRRWARLSRGDVVVGMAPLFHITGLVAHLAITGLIGAPLILAYRFDAGEMLRLIDKWRGSFTVAAITAYIALMNDERFADYDISSLRKAYSGGAPIAPSVVQKFEDATGTYIHNIYGMTETTSPTHAVPLDTKAPVDPETGALSVGVPLPNADIRLVDVATGEDVPAGESGEIASKSPCIVPGYWQKPDETAHAIRDGWMFTGDIGRMDEDGWFYVIDRKKDLINASGFKVWPREVEDVLYEHPAVREAAVVGVPDDYRGETVHAFVSLVPNTDTTPDDLIEFCKNRLANYKYPRQIKILPDLPKTATGKILRRELRD